MGVTYNEQMREVRYQLHQVGCALRGEVSRVRDKLRWSNSRWWLLDHADWTLPPAMIERMHNERMLEEWRRRQRYYEKFGKLIKLNEAIREAQKVIADAYRPVLEATYYAMIALGKAWTQR